MKNPRRKAHTHTRTGWGPKETLVFLSPAFISLENAQQHKGSVTHQQLMQIAETWNQFDWRSLRSSSWIMSYSLSSYTGNVSRTSLLEEEMSSCTPLKLCQALQKRKTVTTPHQVQMGLPGSCLDHSGQKLMEWIGFAAFNMQKEASLVQVFLRVLQ